jgi:DNA repair protein SbcC/Rad50
MLVKLKATFECHKGTEIEFSPGITAICGVNDSGKSSLNRALRWVVCNTPTGDGYLPWWGGGAEVILTADSGEITRGRHKADNYYKVGETVLRAMGRSVPDEVFQMTKVTPLNIQKQVDQYYILNESPGATAKLINEIAGISESDDAIKLVSQVIRDLTGKIEAKKETIKEKSTLAKSLSWTTEAKEDINQIENVSYNLTTTQAELRGMESLYSELDKIQDYLLMFEDLDEAAAAVESIVEAEVGLDTFMLELEELNRLACAFESIDLERFSVLEEVGVLDELSEIGIELEEEQAELHLMAKIRDGLLQQTDYSWLDGVDFSGIDSVEAEIRRLIEEDEQMEIIRAAIEDANKQVDILSRDLARIEAEIAKIPVCTACGREL